MKRPAKALWALAAIATIVGFSFLLVGPHMTEQPNRRTYYHEMRLPPAGAVPVDATAGVPTEAEAARLANPLAATPENIAAGRGYYRYYCTACHGARGDGRGEVGQSFIPAPADLTSARIRSLSDGALYRAILTGQGHAPVTEYAIPEAHRWPLVLYLRTLWAPSAPAK